MPALNTYQTYSYKQDLNVPSFPNDIQLVIMDGDCALCSRSARVISTMDKNEEFKIATVKSPLGSALLKHYGFNVDDPLSWLYVSDGRAYSSLDAIIRVGQKCGGMGHILGIFRILPTGIQDWLYQRIARSRYRLFGRADICSLPDENLQKRLLK